MSDPARADRLSREVATLRGITPRAFGPGGQVAYGTLLFKYVAERDQLVAAVLIADDGMWDKLGDQFRDNYLRSTAALSDPRIGGLFDTGGAQWLFERETGKTFLYRAYPLDTAPAEISRGIDAIARVAPAWETRWSNAVADIALGKAPPPPHRVTLEQDPYAGRM